MAATEVSKIMGLKSERRKGLYVVTESACLVPSTGANKHIEAGLEQLNNYFDITLLPLCTLPAIQQSGSGQQPSFVKRSTILRKMRSGVRWMYILVKNHLPIIRYFLLIRKHSPDFIYERSSYLNFNVLIIAKILRIVHVYEVNGVLAKDNSTYFPRFFNKVSSLLERTANRNTFGFYVGGINKILNIPEEKSMVIQNGIEEQFVKKFSDHTNLIDGKLNLCFIGHAMAHHRLDVLVDALKLIKSPEMFRLHLIGSNLDELRGKIPAGVDTFFYGSLSQSEIESKIRGFNIGIVTFAEPYFSHVKVFMYGAAKLGVLLPASENFRTVFSPNEVIFIENANAADLAEKLEQILYDKTKITILGNAIYDKVSRNYTWREIYKPVAERIDHLINARRTA